MEILQEVATITGKPGLFRIVKPGRAGVIVESLDDTKKREMISANARVSVLKEISIYTTEFNVSVPLAEVFMNLKAKYNAGIDKDIKQADAKTLFSILEEALPNYDPEKVYQRDVVKILSWFNILNAFLPEAFVAESAKD